jgi:hypothetical protein
MYIILKSLQPFGYAYAPGETATLITVPADLIEYLRNEDYIRLSGAPPPQSVAKKKK